MEKSEALTVALNKERDSQFLADLYKSTRRAAIVTVLSALLLERVFYVPAMK